MEKKNLELQGKKQMESKGESTQRRPVFIPAVDIFENRESLILIVDMPGVTNDDVEIYLEDSELTLRGRMRVEPQDLVPVYTEYRSGDYFRSFTLSNVIDQQMIEANMKDGVLKIILPKAETAKPRQITVEVG